MQPQLRVARREIPTMEPVTVRPQPLSVETRVEIIANVIAGVLHNAYTQQTGAPDRPLHFCQPAVQKVYEGLARLAVVPILAPDVQTAAEEKAVNHGLDVLGTYMDEDDDDGIPSDVWQHRITTAVRAAIRTYTESVMAVNL